MLGKYEAENKRKTARLEILRADDKPDNRKDISEKLKLLLCSFTQPEALTQELLYRLVDHIEICQGSFRKKEHGKIKEQSVRIFFKFSGDPVTKTYTK